MSYHALPGFAAQMLHRLRVYCVYLILTANNGIGTDDIVAPQGDKLWMSFSLLLLVLFVLYLCLARCLLVLVPFLSDFPHHGADLPNFIYSQSDLW